MTAEAIPLVRRRTAGISGPVAWIVLGVATVVLYLIFRGQWTLPHEPDAPLFTALNGLADWIRELKRTVPPLGLLLDGIRGGVGLLIDAITGLLVWMGWPGVLGAATTIGYAAGGWRTGVLAAAGLGVLGALGLWELSIETLGITLASVIIAVAIGVPIGIVVGKSDRARAVVTPILDVAQILPQFAYMLPFVILFGIGAAPAALVTLVYAMPAAIRITALGIRGVPWPSVEAARSLGSTNRQILRLVEVPLARVALGLAVNQTIMLALSMVVITVVIDGPGLGVPILRALQRLDVGAMFNAGLAIVVLAIVLDRVTEQAGLRFDPKRIAAAAGRRRRLDRRLVLGVLLAVTGLALAAAVVSPASVAEFPESLAVLSFRTPVNAIVDWIQLNLFWLTDGLKETFTAAIINPFENLLTSTPFWLVIAAVTAIGYLLSGPRAAVIAFAGLLGIVALQLWEHTLQTLVTVLVGTVITLIIGTVLGIAAAKSAGFSRALRPLLDAAQTMPAFVYLLPALALFQATRFTGIVASVVFAIPPVVRLVEAGIRLVPPAQVEAALSAGASPLQLLRKVQLPAARPALMLAVNQGLIMVLGMVVLAALVGAGALGFDVVSGFAQNQDAGLGLAAGIAIVLLGIVLDRISQGAGRRPPAGAAVPQRH